MRAVTLQEPGRLVRATISDDLEPGPAEALVAVRRVAGKLHQNQEITLLFLRETLSIDREAGQKMAQILDQFAFYAKLYLDRAIEQNERSVARSEDIIRQAQAKGNAEAERIGRQARSQALEAKRKNEAARAAAEMRRKRADEALQSVKALLAKATW